ncbi:MAG: imidazolonepropionase, partial [Lachnospiraceae bacterium]|nr:imidazolonepropionase [Lachnospiraceae bacterium]
HELALKLKGVPYLDILAQGGGILSTVRNTRAATEEELTEKAAQALDRMLQMGTTTCEAKSGYGLAKDEELKQLRAIRALQGRQPVELVPTFLGAHALPEEYKNDREAYLRLLTEEMIPAVAEEHLAEFCDVFCETGVFTVEESRTILEAGQKYGLKSKIHADEIDPLGGSQLAGEIGAVSAEHLICSPDEGIESMAKGGTVAVCLPATSFYLDKTFARARDMITAGVPVAVATDFNPGSCPCLSLQLAMNLACFKYRLTPEEVLTAVTLNAAAAICRADTLGSLEAGKQADLVIWDAENLDFSFYSFCDNLVNTVIK